MRCYSIKIRRSFGGEDVAKYVIVYDERRHLRGGQVRVIKSANESQMVLGCEGLSQDLLPSTWRKQDHGVSQVDHHHSTTMIEPPSMADRCWYRHLATC